MAILPGKERATTFPRRLLRLSAQRFAWQHPWQSWLSFTGITLGVMMVVAIDLANSSASRAFSLSLETVNGKITHQIVGGSTGVEEGVYVRLRTELGIRSSAPRISGVISIKGKTFSLLGIDVLSEMSLHRQAYVHIIGGDDFRGSALSDTNSIVMSQSVANELDLETGSSVRLNVDTGRISAVDEKNAVLAGVFTSENPEAVDGLVFGDISFVQQMLNKHGRIDSIDLIINQEQEVLISEWLPEELTLINMHDRHNSLQQLSTAFHINLLAMSLLSMLVAGLLIYNTITLSVLRRQKTLGIYRAQGVTKDELFYLILGEAAILSLVASIVGLILGFGLAHLLLDLVIRAIPDSNFRVNVTSFLISPWSFVKGLLLGLGVTIVSAWIPAWRAMSCRPVTLQQRNVSDQHWQVKIPWLAIVGLLLMGLAYLMLYLEFGALVAGFIALTIMVFGYCLIVPTCMSIFLILILVLFRPLMSLSTKMALRNVQTGIKRTGIAVAALTVALSVTVGIGVMVGSFRGTVVLWLEQSFKGDIEIVGEHFPEPLQVKLRGLHGVDRLSMTTTKTIESDFGQVRLNISDRKAQQSYYLKQGGEANLERFNSGEGVLISEPLAYMQNLSVGEDIVLFTDKGAKSFQILGVFYDYTPSLGLIGLHQSLYREWWVNHEPTRMTLLESEGVTDEQDLLRRVQTLLSEDNELLRALPNRSIRESTLKVFDRTFTITSVLRMLALLVAFVGVLSALLALILERMKEIAILRAIGMTPKQVMKLVMIQTLLMGMFAGLFAVPLGLIMSEILIEVINKRSFGWSMQHILPVGVLVEALVLSLAAAFLAGLFPAYKAAKVNPSSALREE